MEDLERMAIFAQVVEEKSFSAAARRLNLSKSLVSKHITQLEKSLGSRLLESNNAGFKSHRSGRSFLRVLCPHSRGAGGGKTGG